jgi:hypothetical protein
MSAGDLFSRVACILDQARGNVVRVVNSNMVLAYWLVGREIVRELQRGEQRAVAVMGMTPFRTDWGSGNGWMLFHGKSLRAPRRPDFYPESRFVQWHVREVFQGETRYGGDFGMNAADNGIEGRGSARKCVPTWSTCPQLRFSSFPPRRRGIRKRERFPGCCLTDCGRRVGTGGGRSHEIRSGYSSPPFYPVKGI